MSRTVYFDVTPLFEESWTGIPVFTAHLAEQLLGDPEIEVVFGRNCYLIETAAIREALNQQTGLYLGADFARGRNLRAEKSGRLDCALFPSVRSVFSVAQREASVIHDLSTVLTPEFHTPANIVFHRRHLAKEIAANDVTFVVSRATGDDLCYYLDVAPDAVRVAYQYVAWPDQFAAEFEARFGGCQFPPFLAVLGTVEPRKNLRIVLAALRHLRDLDPMLQLVIIGKKGWKLEDALAAEVGDWMAAGRLIVTGYVSEFQKYCYLRSCRMLLFPSLFEGFGIPVLEALSLGKPVLASWSSSIPEIGRDIVQYFDPLSVADLVLQYRAIHERIEHEGEALTRDCFALARTFNRDTFYRPFAQWIHHG